jgi:tetratricopeptide (TPR) repeat protein
MPDPRELLCLRREPEPHRDSGDLDRAIPLYEQALTGCRRVRGDDHPNTLTSVNNLAGAYESAGDMGRAIPLYEQALTDCRRVLGDDHPDTLSSVNNLASAYRSAGDLGRAIPLFEQALTDSRRCTAPRARHQVLLQQCPRVVDPLGDYQGIQPLSGQAWAHDRPKVLSRLTRASLGRPGWLGGCGSCCWPLRESRTRRSPTRSGSRVRR